MNTILERVSLVGIVPVIKIDEVEKAVPLARALCAGGLPVAEVTFRTAQAAEAISRITREVPEMLVGAGTILTCEQADKALESGARFIVSPGLNPRVVRHCMERGVPITPGCSSPSDMELAMELGLDAIKFFPAEQAGGVAYLKAVAAPYGGLRFMPTGGIGIQNMNDYLCFDKVFACGGSWMVKPELIDGGDWAAISALSREAVQTMLGFQLRHIGVNCADEAEASTSATAFSTLFGLPEKAGASSVFSGSMLEYMKSAGRGAHGHIAVSTYNVDRAIYHLGLRGAKFDDSSRKVDSKGRTTFIYLEREISGFAIHLIQA